jgi:hypothetical protein
MAQWQKTFTRESPKTKAELREMLTEAVRNTQPEPKRPPKAAGKIATKAACVD